MRTAHRLRLALLIAALLVPTGAAAQTWSWVNPLPTGNYLRDIEVVGPNATYFFASGGTVLRSADGGRTFATSRYNSAALTVRARFATPSVGWVVTGDGEIFHTADAGATWALQYRDADRFELTAVDFADAARGWATGNGSFADRRMLRTVDGGVTWSNVPTPPPPSTGSDGFYYVKALGAEGAIAVSYANLVYRTDDGGATWDTTRISVPALYDLYLDAAFVNDTLGFAVGLGQTIARTTDGGRTWERRLGSADSTDDNTSFLAKVEFADARVGWAAAFGCLFRTDDGGDSWTRACNADAVSRKDDLALLDARSGYVTDGTALLKTADGGVTFENLIDGPTQTLRAAAFAGANTAWAVGAEGTILHTRDGWRTFARQPSGVAVTLRAAAFRDALNGWAVGNGGRVVRTADGGATWAEGTSGFAGTLNGLAHAGGDALVAVGNGGTILASADAGATWAPRASGTDDHLRAVDFADAARGWAVGDTGFVATTFDGGATWARQASGVLSNLNDVFFLTPSRGWAVGNAGTVLHTVDGGVTWRPQVSGTTVALNRAFFLDERTGWIAGFATVLKTTDGGATWTADPANISSATHYDVFFAEAGRGWMFGSGGAILRFGSDVTAAEPDARAAIGAVRAYPNPTRGAATVAFALDRPARVTVRVYALDGRLVAETAADLGAGEQAVRLGAAALAPGVYFARVAAGADVLGTARVVILR